MDRTNPDHVPFVKEHDPEILKKIYERFYATRRSKKQLYDPLTHKLRIGIDNKAEALIILLSVRQMAQSANIKNFWFSKDELKLLDPVVSRDSTGSNVTKNLISSLTDSYDPGQTKSHMPHEIADASKRLTVKEVAALLGFNEFTIYKMAASGRIPCIKIRRHIRFRLSDIEKWEDKHSYGKF